MIRYNEGAGVWEEIKTPDGAKKYVTKYALKPKQKQVPKEYQNCGRFWGCSKDLIPQVKDHYYAQEREVRELLRLANHPLSDAEYLPKLVWGIK